MHLSMPSNTFEEPQHAAMSMASPPSITPRNRPLHGTATSMRRVVVRPRAAWQHQPQREWLPPAAQPVAHCVNRSRTPLHAAPGRTMHDTPTRLGRSRWRRQRRRPHRQRLAHLVDLLRVLRTLEHQPFDLPGWSQNSAGGDRCRRHGVPPAGPRSTGASVPVAPRSGLPQKTRSARAQRRKGRPGLTKRLLTRLMRRWATVSTAVMPFSGPGARDEGGKVRISPPRGASVRFALV